ncbi:MAG TPA: response regulator transcription factor [Anaerolineales bacterium]|nr:response regulator transcription factor [Anaerolineales bacterium]
MSICILIADDHAVVRQGLRMFLETDADFKVVGEAENGEDAVRLAGELQPDIVLMDLIMPGMDGITATSRIRRQYPDVEVIALTSVLDDGSIFGAIRAGAIGYLLKDTKADKLISAVKSADAGQVQLSPQVAERLLREIDLPDVIEPLTDRERDVLRMLALGCSNKDIARDLNIGDKTVKTHVSSILSKLGVTSRTQAVIYALRTGLVMFPPGQS